MVAVSIEKLEKRFGDTVVLDGVTAEIADGSFAVLVGPSGCGKSTLLRLLAGLERPTSGRIRFGQREVTSLEPRERDVAMVFQSYALYPHLSVKDNLAFGLKLQKASAREIDRRVAEVSEMLGLGLLLGRKPSELSGGQRQRVAMGRAIARRPSLFLFDEPLSNLDAALRAQVRVDIKKLHARLGTTSVYVTHDQVEALTLADVMFVLNKGRVEQQGAPLAVYDAPATRFVASFLGSPAMSFLEGRIVRKGTSFGVELSGGDGAACIEVEERRFGGLEEGRSVSVGIRPHDLVRGEGSLEIEVAFTEELGAEAYAHGSVSGQALVVRLDGPERARVGERISLATTKLHLFDAESGESLAC